MLAAGKKKKKTAGTLEGGRLPAARRGRFVADRTREKDGVARKERESKLQAWFPAGFCPEGGKKKRPAKVRGFSVVSSWGEGRRPALLFLGQKKGKGQGERGEGTATCASLSPVKEETETKKKKKPHNGRRKEERIPIFIHLDANKGGKGKDGGGEPKTSVGRLRRRKIQPRPEKS